MIRQILSNPEPINIVITVFSYIVILFICFPVHESAHALTAKFLGDKTAESQGRISLNPLVHLDPMGTIGLLLFGIGWAKPVPVQPYRARKVSQKSAMAITAAAGPISNVLVSLFFMIVAKIIILLSSGDVIVAFGNSLYGVSSTTIGYIIIAIELVISINLGLGVFNLLPIPPFDGSRILLAFLPTKLYFKVMEYERFIMIAVLVLLYTGILSIPFGILESLIYSGLDFITGFIC